MSEKLAVKQQKPEENFITFTIKYFAIGCFSILRIALLQSLKLIYNFNFLKLIQNFLYYTEKKNLFFFCLI